MGKGSHCHLGEQDSELSRDRAGTAAQGREHPRSEISSSWHSFHGGLIFSNTFDFPAVGASWVHPYGGFMKVLLRQWARERELAFEGLIVWMARGAQARQW